jgi:hypothetical protein
MTRKIEFLIVGGYISETLDKLQFKMNSDRDQFTNEIAMRRMLSKTKKNDRGID